MDDLKLAAEKFIEWLKFSYIPTPNSSQKIVQYDFYLEYARSIRGVGILIPIIAFEVLRRVNGFSHVAMTVDPADPGRYFLRGLSRRPKIVARGEENESIVQHGLVSLVRPELSPVPLTSDLRIDKSVDVSSSVSSSQQSESTHSLLDDTESSLSVQSSAIAPARPKSATLANTDPFDERGGSLSIQGQEDSQCEAIGRAKRKIEEFIPGLVEILATEGDCSDATRIFLWKMAEGMASTSLYLDVAFNVATRRRKRIRDEM